MRQIVRRAAEMKKSVKMRRPDYKFCPFCDVKVGQEEKICPACGRLTVRNLRAAGCTELLEDGGEPYFCRQERRRKNRILFEQIAEEADTGLALKP